MKIFLQVLFLFGIVLRASTFPQLTSERVLRWCCISGEEFAKCVTLPEFEFPYDCVPPDDSVDEIDRLEDCVQQIENGEADLVSMDGGEIYHYRHRLIVAVAEDYGLGSSSYYGVAVVRAESERTIETLQDLKSCHTAIGKTAGWIVPMGTLLRLGKDPDTTFSQSCAPGANLPTYIDKYLHGNGDDKWCSLCIGKREDGSRKCARNFDEQYYSYDGAFKCLDDGAGDVAFVKHTTVPKELYGQYKLLCLNGTTASPSEWTSCHLARVPSHAVMMRLGTAESETGKVLSILNNAKRAIPDEIFSYGKNLLWKNSITDFVEPGHRDPVSFLGDAYRCNYQAATTKVVEEDCRINQ